MTNADTTDKSIKTAETVFDILETIAEGDCTTVSSVAERLDYSKSTIHYYLKTLEKRRYIVKEEGQYRLGLRAAYLGSKATDQYAPWAFIQERTDDLSRELDTAANVVVEEAGRAVVLHRSGTEAERLVQTHIGMEVGIHSTAFGKVILTFLPSDKRDEILYSDCPEGTAGPPDEYDELLQELDKVRDVGLAYAEEGFAEGVSSIAAPIVRESTGALFGAIGIWGRTEWLTDPTKHAKARRFANETTEEVEKVARIIGNRI